MRDGLLIERIKELTDGSYIGRGPDLLDHRFGVIATPLTEQARAWPLRRPLNVLPPRSITWGRRPPAGAIREAFQGGIFMLIITRRAGEKIMLGDDIVIHVMEIVGSSVRLGIEAPRSVPVYREEIWNAVRAEGQAAADAAPDELPGTPKRED
jgi:carbon storage regulator